MPFSVTADGFLADATATPSTFSWWVRSGDHGHHCYAITCVMLDRIPRVGGPVGRLSFSQMLLFGSLRAPGSGPYTGSCIGESTIPAYLGRIWEFPASEKGRYALSIQRVCRPCAQSCDWAVYAESATKPPRLCALRFRGGTRAPNLVACSFMDVPSVWIYRFRETCRIPGLGLLALVAFRED